MYSIKSHLRKAGQPASGKAAWGGVGSASPRKPHLAAHRVPSACLHQGARARDGSEA